MAKHKNKKKKKTDRNSDGVSPMDVSTLPVSHRSAAVAAPPSRPQAMDTSELPTSAPTSGSMLDSGNITSLGVSVTGNKKMKKVSQKRRAVKIRKEKALKKALEVSEKRRKKLQQDESKAHRVQTLKNLY